MTQRSMSVRFLLAAAVGLALAGFSAAQTTTYDMRSGEVLAVDGNNLIVKGPDGVKQFVVDDAFRFDMDGKPVSVHDLKPGMKLTALITTTTTPVDLVATELRDAEVIHTIGNSVVVRNSEDGKYRRFTSEEMKAMDLVIYKDGSVVQPSALRKGDRINATIVTKLPPAVVTEREIAVLAQKPEVKIPAGSVPVTRVQGRDPSPAPVPDPPVPLPPPPPPPPPAPAKVLPKTASLLPLVGVLGALALAAGAGLTVRRRFANR